MLEGTFLLYWTRTHTTTTALNGALLSVWGRCHTRSGVSHAMDLNQVVSVYEGKQIFHNPRDAPSPDAGTWCPYAPLHVPALSPAVP